VETWFVNEVRRKVGMWRAGGRVGVGITIRDRLRVLLRVEQPLRARSRPFHVPATGRIAVKVLNHYGDEVLKVCLRGRRERPGQSPRPICFMNPTRS
jgi:hypothetical protein